ncbi:peptide-methionine (S)-S-oxide reductase MsrA [Paraburkholderia caballeronis]|uniref:peptide-methionine (S)-S-oxide reductase MsrA n=1 Tax=Paraburkholderia caballeronis TaxID=416943 RepID=UPI001065C7F0|nr:peptide-methionine (S)-S-oxide reductase MsrA [Paraburkholderia caballeronis]TDV14908.1 peptide-methionine (S)-S-oxide reductase [Paraburkholderia caballeronis]TDV16968.1 peptide-methionine (S)-S-oxide reductase [Paraburkholderia caballeronis]TDV25644.1 peptide-methionine (S)-S-oxide reductase [Paraburkholderia caballeronis]TDV34281.1 peptide-methionine (S)-S-oxide reductase [Paraburkholderia caballeronis]
MQEASRFSRTSRTSRRRFGWRWPLLAAVTLFAAAAALVQPPVLAGEARVVPPPTLDEKDASTGAPPSETAVLAGGCFWGVQGVFQHVRGVTSAVSGYTGGDRASAQYETVSTGTTGHAESVRITFDPRQISYGQILQIYFSVAHDPTELNRQGPDVGTQYRSTIFPTTPAQARIARAYLAQLRDGHAFSASPVTTVEADRTFYPAETYHQNYLTLHPDASYIAINDMPKLADLKRLFPARYREQPVLVDTSVRASAS